MGTAWWTSRRAPGELVPVLTLAGLSFRGSLWWSIGSEFWGKLSPHWPHLYSFWSGRFLEEMTIWVVLSAFPGHYSYRVPLCGFSEACRWLMVTSIYKCLYCHSQRELKSLWTGHFGKLSHWGMMETAVGSVTSGVSLTWRFFEQWSMGWHSS